jgi:molybdopterin biosynthesis enzyme MoaB
VAILEINGDITAANLTIEVASLHVDARVPGLAMMILKSSFKATISKIDTQNVDTIHRYSLSIKLPDTATISRRLKKRIVYLLTEALKRYNNSVPLATNYRD